MAKFSYSSVGIILGDPRGIGPEIICKTLSKNKWRNKYNPVLIGAENSLLQGMRHSNKVLDYQIMEDIDPSSTRIYLIPVSDSSMDNYTKDNYNMNRIIGEYIIESFRTAITKVIAGEIESLVYGPLNKENLHAANSQYYDEHDLLRHLWSFHELSFEMNHVANIWTSRVTSHVPLMEVGSLLTTERIVNVIQRTNSVLKMFGYKNPKIFVCALNPHGGEGGLFGLEEAEIIMPAIDAVIEEGYNVSGPFPADSVFARAFNGECDAVVTLYHDQGQIALKTKQFHKGITLFAGLPALVATTGHGTAIDLMGLGIADESSFESALDYIMEAKRVS